MKSELKNFYRASFWLSLFGIIALIVDFGYSQSEIEQIELNEFYFLVILFGFSSTLLRFRDGLSKINRHVLIFDMATMLYTFVVVFFHFFIEEHPESNSIFFDDAWVKMAVVFTFLREFSERNFNFNRTYLNPAQLFISSFFVIILGGAFLLMMPKATNGGLGFTDALFTSTSAVCVTGLTVVDTGSYFTRFGQTIILTLIQIGGLGILTFTSYFSYFFKGGATYENQLVLSDLTNSSKIGEVFSTLKHILAITIVIELIGASLIYFTIDKTMFSNTADGIFFAGFHSVSAFCNAGFSSLSNSLYEPAVQFNYPFQFIIILIFVFGGLGFPIIVNILRYIKSKILFFIPFKEEPAKYRPWVLNLTSRITLITTATLSLIAFLLFYFIEYDKTLAVHQGAGKVITALFGATTPRTAGFNSVDMAELSVPIIIMYLLLMWIGASPSSTGGGIKTSTFAIATLNILSLAKGKDRIEVFRREIPEISVRRAHAIISLSLIVIGSAIFMITIFDPGKNISDIVFECFSAYSTVGLSLGITPDLSTNSKFVIMMVMFIGRVSMLSILIAVFRKVKYKNYKYPNEEIMIN